MNQLNQDYCNYPLLLTRDLGSIHGSGNSMVWEAIDSHGAILFRGYGLKADEFYLYASQFSKGFMTSPFGDRKTLSTKNELQTVTLGNSKLDLHFEFGNSPIRPDLLWFYCQTPAAEGKGGETVVADGVVIFDKLCLSTQEALLRRQIKYTIFFPRRALEAMFASNKVLNEIIGSNNIETLWGIDGVNLIEQTKDRVIFEFTAPAVRPAINGHMQVCQNMFTDVYKRPGDKDAERSFSTLVTWKDGSEIHQELIDELKAAAKSVTRAIRWQTGDFVVIDNNRMLHGRSAIADSTRDILILCSFSTRYNLYS